MFKIMKLDWNFDADRIWKLLDCEIYNIKVGDIEINLQRKVKSKV